MYYRLDPTPGCRRHRPIVCEELDATLSDKTSKYMSETASEHPILSSPRRYQMSPLDVTSTKSCTFHNKTRLHFFSYKSHFKNQWFTIPCLPTAGWTAARTPGAWCGTSGKRRLKRLVWTKRVQRTPLGTAKVGFATLLVAFGSVWTTRVQSSKHRVFWKLLVR